jgi:hypothetical protein
VGLRPTLFLGVGGLAAATLRRLKKRLRERNSDSAAGGIFRFLLVDTDREGLRRSRQGEFGDGMDVTETLLTPLQHPEHYRPESRKLLRWLDRRWFYGIPRSLLTEGMRPLGRLALVDNAADVLSRLREALGQITQPRTIADAVNATGSEVRDATPRVFVVASIAGGTGSGMAACLAYAVRQVLGEMGLSAAGLCGMLLFATSPKPADQEVARANASATLGELDYFSRPDHPYPGDADYGLQPFPAGHPPFEETYLVHLGEQMDAAHAEASTETAAEYLFLDACAATGSFLDQLRVQTQAAPGGPFLLRTFGLARIDAQGERPLDAAARRLCRQLAEKWASGPGEAEGKYIEREAQHQLAAEGVQEQAVVARLQGAVAEALGDPPEAVLHRVLALASKAAGSDLPHRLLGPLDRAFAARADREDEGGWPPVQAVVRKSAAEGGMQLARALLNWLVRLVEIPGKRFKAAEQATAFLTQEVAKLAQTAADRLSRIQSQRQMLRRQIETEKPRGKGGFGWLARALGGGGPTAEGELLGYCRVWLREVVEANAVFLLEIVQGELSEVLHSLAVGRQRVQQFADRFPLPEVPPGSQTLPLAQSSGDEADEGGEGPSAEPITPDLVFRFDHSFQSDVLERQGGLWGVFARSNEPGDVPRPTAETLAEDLLIRARSAIQGSFQDHDAAQAFLQANGGPDKALSLLLTHFEMARPRLRAPGAWEHLMLALPEGPAGKTLGGMVAAALRDVPAAVVHTEEEFLLCHEAARCPLREITRSLLGPAGAPPDLVRRVMTRLDVPWALADS